MEWIKPRVSQGQRGWGGGGWFQEWFQECFLSNGRDSSVNMLQKKLLHMPPHGSGVGLY